MNIILIFLIILLAGVPISIDRDAQLDGEGGSWLLRKWTYEIAGWFGCLATPTGLGLIYITNSGWPLLLAFISPITGGLYLSQAVYTDQDNLSAPLSATTADSNAVARSQNGLETKESSSDSDIKEATADVDQLQEWATDALTRGEEAEANDQYQKAADAYVEAINYLEQAVAAADYGTRKELKTEIDEIQISLDAVKAVDERRESVATTTDSDAESTPDNHRTAADAAVETAVSAESNGNFGEAADAYSEALSEYQSALDNLDAGTTEQRVEIEQAIESTRADLEAVKTRREQQNEVSDALQPAERSLQEAIVAYIENEQTVTRIRFRQARDTFENVHETIAESEEDLLTDPIEVSVQPDRKPTSTALSELSVIPDASATALADAGIETVDDLDSGDESPWTPATIEELPDDDTINEDVETVLTLLSWWHGDESYTFDTAEAVERRQQQADYGFNHTS